MRQIPRAEGGRPRQHHAVVQPGLEEAWADPTLELGKCFVFELRRGAIFRHSRHCGGGRGETSIELSRQGLPEHRVHDEREEPQDAREDRERRGGQAKSQRSRHARAPSEYPRPRWVWSSFSGCPSSIFLRR